MHNEQRKAETIVRELKAKSRSLKAKISHKMDATRKLEGTKSPPNTHTHTFQKKGSVKFMVGINS